MAQKNPWPMTPQMEEAATLYLAGATIEEVAKKLQVSYITVWRWLRHPQFAEKVKQYHDERREIAQSACHSVMLDAIQVLTVMMRNNRVAPGVRLRAAAEILDRVGWRPVLDAASEGQSDGVKKLAAAMAEIMGPEKSKNAAKSIDEED